MHYMPFIPLDWLELSAWNHPMRVTSYTASVERRLTDRCNFSPATAKAA